jgi:Derlin-2/3
MLTVP